MLFGEIMNGEMRLNEFGEIVRDEWEKTTAIRPNVELGEYVVMPNHFHVIVVFVDGIVGATGPVAPTEAYNYFIEGNHARIQTPSQSISVPRS